MGAKQTKPATTVSIEWSAVTEEQRSGIKAVITGLVDNAQFTIAETARSHTVSIPLSTTNGPFQLNHEFCNVDPHTITRYLSVMKDIMNDLEETIIAKVQAQTNRPFVVLSNICHCPTCLKFHVLFVVAK